MKDPTQPIESSSTAKIKGTWRKAILGLGIVLLWLPIVQVLCLRWVNPPTTMPRLLWQLKYAFHPEKKSMPIRWLDLKDTSDDFVDAVIYAEDLSFFEHHGFDFGAIKTAIHESQVTGKPPRGASTITQQCARSTFLWQGRSWIRKGFEAYYSIWMELLLSKKRILTIYANVIELGDGVYGLEAGAYHHFGISGKSLNAEQLSKLLAIMPNPKRWNPNDLPPAPQARQLWILDHINSLHGNRISTQWQRYPQGVIIMPANPPPTAAEIDRAR